AIGICRAGLTILKRRLNKIADVINDDVATGRAQVANILGKGGDRGVGRSEKELRARRNVMNDFEHCGAFITASRLTWKHGNRAQIPQCLRCRQVGYAVRNNADLDSGPCDVEGASRRRGSMRGVTLGRGAANSQRAIGENAASYGSLLQ